MNRSLAVLSVFLASLSAHAIELRCQADVGTRALTEGRTTLLCLEKTTGSFFESEDVEIDPSRRFSAFSDERGMAAIGAIRIACPSLGGKALGRMADGRSVIVGKVVAKAPAAAKGATGLCYAVGDSAFRLPGAETLAGTMLTKANAPRAKEPGSLALMGSIERSLRAGL
jgi:hypothetical protein